MSSKIITPVGFIRSDFNEKFGIPRQSGRINNLAEIVFNPPYNDKNAFRGIEKFSHVWLIFGFSKIPEKEFSPLVRPPKLGGNEKVGVFSSRSPFRPNGLGLSVVQLISVNTDNGGVSLTVKGADLIDETPIYDVKPYLKKYECIADATCGFTDDYKDEKLKFIIPDSAKEILGDKAQTLAECLSEDPRPAYHDDGRIYGFKFAGYEVKFSVSNGVLTVLSVTK